MQYQFGKLQLCCTSLDAGHANVFTSYLAQEKVVQTVLHLHGTGIVKLTTSLAISKMLGWVSAF